MTLSTSTQSIRFAHEYLPALWSGNLDKFSSLLDENVHFVHFANGIEDYNVRGSEAVTQLFRENFTDKMKYIEVSSVSYRAKESNAEYRLLSTQKMSENGPCIHYEDFTQFKLSYENNALRITAIMMIVTSKTE